MVPEGPNHQNSCAARKRSPFIMYPIDPPGSEWPNMAWKSRRLRWRCTIRARIRATVTLCFPELRSRQRGKGPPCRPLDARVVATLTRHQVHEIGSRARAMLSSPASLAARTWCMLTHLPELLSARIPLCSLVAAALPRRSTSQRVIGVAGGSRQCCLIHSPDKNEQRSSAPQPASRCSACRGMPRKERCMRKGLWHRHFLLRGDGRCSGPKLYHHTISGRPPCATSGCSQLYMCSS